MASATDEGRLRVQGAAVDSLKSDEAIFERNDPGQVTVSKIIFAVEQIVGRTHPVRVVAFGSRARGDHRSGSDLDLAVIVDRYDRKRDLRPIWRADIDVWMDMDVLVYDVEREQAMKDSLVSVQSEVAREGVTLYEREKGDIDYAAIAGLVS